MANYNFCPNCGSQKAIYMNKCNFCGYVCEQVLPQKSNNFFTYSGRMSRLPYFWNCILISIISNIPFLILFNNCPAFYSVYIAIFPNLEYLGFHSPSYNNALTLIGLLLYIPILYFGFVLIKKRFADIYGTEKEIIWKVLMAYIPIIGFFVGLYLLFKSGNKEEQQFYPNQNYNYNNARNYQNHNPHPNNYCQAQAVKGQDIISNISITKEEILRGKVITINGLQIQIPREILNINGDKRVKLEGNGQPGLNGGPNGDLYINLNIKQDIQQTPYIAQICTDE